MSSLEKRSDIRDEVISHSTADAEHRQYQRHLRLRAMECIDYAKQPVSMDGEYENYWFCVRNKFSRWRGRHQEPIKNRDVDADPPADYQHDEQKGLDVTRYVNIQKSSEHNIKCAHIGDWDGGRGDAGKAVEVSEAEKDSILFSFWQEGEFVMDPSKDATK